jgi:hypothetical protein
VAQDWSNLNVLLPETITATATEESMDELLERLR